MADLPKIYSKAGKPNYREKQLIEKIHAGLAEKAAKDPSILKDFTPAKDMDGLMALYDKYAIDDVSFTETKTGDVAGGGSGGQNIHDGPEPDQKDLFNIDPMNREEPIIRDYVQGNDFTEQAQIGEHSGQTVFNEPTTFSEAFTMPEDQPNNNGGQQSGNQSGGAFGGGGQKPPPKKPINPINPDFNDMSGAKKKRSTQKFAKYIVEAVCMLSEKGFVWYATKDINEAKLIEYELNNEMDLSVLIQLENGQEVAIKQFFINQCLAAEQLAKFDPEEKKDLIDALADVMLEKGIAPTPTQELMMIGLTMFGKQVITLFAFTAQNNHLLMQLRQMKSETVPHTEVKTPAPQPQKPDPAVSRQAPDEPEEVVAVPKPVEEKIAAEERALANKRSGVKGEGTFEELEESLIIDQPIDTKE